MTAVHRALPTYEDLLEEIAWLRGELGLEVAAEKLSRVCRDLRLTPAEARLLLLLHARRGRVVTRAFAEDNIPARSGQSDIISVWVSRIRDKLGFGAVVTHWGLGFSAPPATLARIDALFQDLA